MAALTLLRNVIWALTNLTEVVLLVYLIRRNFRHTHPAFFSYLLGVIVQAVLLLTTYSIAGFDSDPARNIGWSSQFVITCLRFLAVFEVAKCILSPYAGIWGLARRLLLGCALVVLIYTISFSSWDWRMIILSIQKSAELGIAAFIVALLLFARYYRLPIPDLYRSLAVGFGLYSCFVVINDTLLERYLLTYETSWGFLDMFTYLASLSVWIVAVRAYDPAKAAAKVAVSDPDRLAELRPELNLRLRLLNDQLQSLMDSGSRRP